MTRAVAKEVGGDGILVNTVSPGFTMSDGVLANPVQVEKLQEISLKARLVQREPVPGGHRRGGRFFCSPTPISSPAIPLSSTAGHSSTDANLPAGHRARRARPADRATRALYDVAANTAASRRRRLHLESGRQLSFELVGEPAAARDGARARARPGRLPPAATASTSRAGLVRSCTPTRARASASCCSLDPHRDGVRPRVQPGEPWFETGHDPVHAKTHADEPSAFVALHGAAARALGSPSIRYVRDEDRDRPQVAALHGVSWRAGSIVRSGGQLLADQLALHASSWRSASRGRATSRCSTGSTRTATGYAW